MPIPSLSTPNAAASATWPHAPDEPVALGADFLELDVYLSKDGVLVVIHDRPSTERPRESVP